MNEIIDIITAFFTAVLSGMGVGGGGLLLIYLSLFRDVPQLTAQLANLAFFIAASAASLTVHILKRKISASVVLIIASGGLVGAFFGSGIASLADEGILRLILGVFLFLSGAFSLFGGARLFSAKTGRD